MDDSFGHWLAGFIDGEGCFCIAINGASRACSLNVALRRDDRALLEEIQQRTGLGKVYDSPGRGSTKPYSRWVVQSQSGSQQIVALLERYPLRSKKARDFELWKQAVAIWCTGRQGTPDPLRWPRMQSLKERLILERTFAQ